MAIWFRVRQFWGPVGQDSGASLGWFLPSLWIPRLRLRSPVSIPRKVYERTDAAGVVALCPCHSAWVTPVQLEPQRRADYRLLLLNRPYHYLGNSGNSFLLFAFYLFRQAVLLQRLWKWIVPDFFIPDHSASVKFSRISFKARNVCMGEVMLQERAQG